MVNIYENVIEEFNKQNCKLLTTKEEYIDILKNTKKVYRLNYIASCGHTHIVFYNVFKSRGTGIVCPSCKNKKIGYDKKEKMKNNEMSKTSTIEQEYKFINQIQLFLKNDFEIIKAFDGCNIDIIFKPKNIIDDKWVGIQVKTTNVRHLTYSFHINNIYKNCLLLFYCCEDETMWLIPENIIGNQKKVSIGYNKSKYNIYKICKDNLINKLNEFYNKTNNFEFDKLNTPTCIYQQREQFFRKYREEKIKFLDFDYDSIEGTVYDFKIKNFKVQEKVAKISDKENRYYFQLCKNNGLINGKQNQIQYDIGDNDFYWLNCDNKQTFFVIPEKNLIDKGFIGNKIENINRQMLKITVKNVLHKKSAWLQDYMFDYENIDKERLLTILQQ
jgi:7-cyano-7-deazaguanine synthase in queuosine biosynthesis